VRDNKRYAAADKFTVQETAEAVKADVGNIDVLVHSLANGPEVTKPLLETSRKVLSFNVLIAQASRCSSRHWTPSAKPAALQVATVKLAPSAVH
jgi:enoyl-[acyl-carrier-protein] reductase (NADH)